MNSMSQNSMNSNFTIGTSRSEVLAASTRTSFDRAPRRDFRAVARLAWLFTPISLTPTPAALTAIARKSRSRTLAAQVDARSHLLFGARMAFSAFDQKRSPKGE
jgi:hypothetical protein